MKIPIGFEDRGNLSFTGSILAAADFENFELEVVAVQAYPISLNIVEPPHARPLDFVELPYARQYSHCSRTLRHILMALTPYFIAAHRSLTAVELSHARAI